MPDLTPSTGGPEAEVDPALAIARLPLQIGEAELAALTAADAVRSAPVIKAIGFKAEE